MTTDLTQLETLLKESSPTPWIKVHTDSNCIFDGCGDFVSDEKGIAEKEDCDLIIALRNAAPDLIAEIKRLREADEWLDISTAPRDGTGFLGFRRINGGEFRQCCWLEEQSAFGGCGWTYPQWNEPTHWKPLPKPPNL